jgi:hypothetical protein
VVVDVQLRVQLGHLLGLLGGGPTRHCVLKSAV